MLVRYDKGIPPNKRIASFDLDDTLQSTTTGQPNYMANNWEFRMWSPEVAPKLRALHKAGAVQVCCLTTKVFCYQIQHMETE